MSKTLFRLRCPALLSNAPRPSSFLSQHPVKTHASHSSASGGGGGAPATTRRFWSLGARRDEGHRGDLVIKGKGPLGPTAAYDFEKMTKMSESPQPNLYIVDTREPSELQAKGTIPHALNVPVNTHPEAFGLPPDEFRLLFGFDLPDPGTSVLVMFCRAGVRAKEAAGLARDAGYPYVGMYPGSWLDWEKNEGRTEQYEPKGRIWLEGNEVADPGQK